MPTIDSELLRRADDGLINLWFFRTRRIKRSYGEYNGRPVARIWSSKGSPCKKVLRSYGMFTFLADLCIEFIRLRWVPRSILEQTYYHFRKHPHFKPKEVENYVKEIYKKQNSADNINTR